MDVRSSAPEPKSTLVIHMMISIGDGILLIGNELFPIRGNPDREACAVARQLGLGAAIGVTDPNNCSMKSKPMVLRSALVEGE